MPPRSVSVPVSATDPSRTPSGETQPSLRVLLPGGPPTLVHDNEKNTTLMTTPVTVSQVTSPRRQNIHAAAGHRRRARRSPGRSPGTTDFASRPGFPLDLGWGPLREPGESRCACPGSCAGGRSFRPLARTAFTRSALSPKHTRSRATHRRASSLLARVWPALPERVYRARGAPPCSTVSARARVPPPGRARRACQSARTPCVRTLA